MDEEEYYLLGCDALLCGISSQTFRRNVLPPSSGLRISRESSKHSKAVSMGKMIGRRK
jgi:hypothetical protein